MTTMTMNHIQTILSFENEKASNVLIPFDIVNKIIEFYIEGKSILYYYHLVKHRFSKYEKQSIIVASFKKMYKENFSINDDEDVDSAYDDDSEYEYDKDEVKENTFRNILGFVAIECQKNEQILKNFTEMIFEIEDLLIDENLRKTIFSYHSFMNIYSPLKKVFSLDLLKVLFKHSEDIPGTWTCLIICNASNKEILDWLCETFKFEKDFFQGEYSYLLNFFEYAIAHEDFEMLEWLYSKNPRKLENSLYNEAKKKKSIKSFEWLYSKGCVWNPSLYMNNRDEKEFLSFAKERGLPFKQL